jgi:5'-3' exonuclease
MLALIDGDVLCYHACKSRWAKTHLNVDGEKLVYLDSEGKRIEQEYTKEEDQEYLMASWELLQSTLENLLECVFAKSYLMAVKGPDNFRNLLYPEYKLNRHADPTKQNAFVPVLRKLCVAEGLAIESHGREADDLLRIWAEQAMAAGDPYVVCTIDKDLKCIPGNFFNMRSNEVSKITSEAAERHYFEQLLKGDPTDNIPGIPKVGPVKATAMLANCSTTSEFQEEVVGQYMIAYGDNWREYLLSNAKMIHLQRDRDDYFSFKDWPVVHEL